MKLSLRAKKEIREYLRVVDIDSLPKEKRLPLIKELIANFREIEELSLWEKFQSIYVFNK
jgi:hypothetical protein